MKMKLVIWSAALAGAMLAGCGGGGGGDDPAPTVNHNAIREEDGGGKDGGSPAPAFRSFAGSETALPGKLLVNSPDGRAYLVDFKTGERTFLPQDPADPIQTEWDGDVQSSLAVRYTSNIAERREVSVSLFDTDSFQPVRAITIWSEFHTLKVSPNQRYLLDFWHDGSQGVFSDEENPLTVFDAMDGSVLKRGSLMDETQSVISSPHAWLPDGSYVYMVANKLYRYAPDRDTDELLAVLKLPTNNVFKEQLPIQGYSALATSPDGQHIAFSWREHRRSVMDMHIWVAKLDGSDLHRLTRVPDDDSPLEYNFVGPAWSPDGKWVMGVLSMDGAVTAPIPGDSEFNFWQVVGTTGCGVSPVFILGADQTNVRIPWPGAGEHAVYAKAANGKALERITTCSSARWLR